MPAVFVYEYCTALGLGRDEFDPAHSLEREGRAMRDAAAADFAAAPGVSVLTLDGSPEPEEHARFVELAKRASACLLIAPEFDGILERRYQWAAEAGCPVLGPSLEAVRLTADKFALYEHWKSHGVPTPQTWPIRDWPGTDFPVVLKPRFGAGSSGTVLLRRAEDLMKSWLFAGGYQLSESIVQPFAAGQAASVAFLVGENETVALPPAFQFIASDGTFAYQGGEVPLPADLAARATALGRQAVGCVPGLRGYVGVDLLLGDEADLAVEINPRLTTSYVGLRQLADGNLAAAMLRVCRGEPVGELAWKAGGVRFRPDGTAEPTAAG